MIAFLPIVKPVKNLDCPTPSKRNEAYVELIRTIAELPAFPISTHSVSLLEEIDPVALKYETPLFCKSVRAVKIFVSFTTSEPGTVTWPPCSIVF